MPFIVSPDGTCRYSEPPEQDRDFDVYVGHAEEDRIPADHIIEVLSKSGLRIYNSSRAWLGLAEAVGNVSNRLDRSRRYLLLASHHAAGSRFVDEELRYWIERRDIGDIVIGLIEGEFESNTLPSILRDSLRNKLWLDLRNFSQDDTRTVGLLLDAFHERSKSPGEFTQFFGKSPAREPISGEHEAAGGDLHLGRGDYIGRELGGHSTAEERPVASAAASQPAPGSRGRDLGWRRASMRKSS